jgi:hypothetical protein
MIIHRPSMNDASTKVEASSALYPQLIGRAWSELDERVRQIHLEADRRSVRAAGVFRIWRGSHWLARFLASLMRLPSAAEAVTMRLRVTANAKYERWERVFGRRPLISRQSALESELLVEEVGGVELRFRLAVTQHGLDYESVGVALRLGPIRLPLPGWMSPRIAAREEPGNDPRQAHVQVLVTLPRVGLLLGYEGHISNDEAPL